MIEARTYYQPQFLPMRVSIPGVSPAAEPLIAFCVQKGATFVWQNWLKPSSTGRNPVGCLRLCAEFNGCATRITQTVPAKKVDWVQRLSRVQDDFLPQYTLANDLTVF